MILYAKIIISGDIMGLFNYIKNKKKYKTEELYVGLLREVNYYSKKTRLKKLAILKKLTHNETLKQLKLGYDYCLFRKDFWEFVPNYMQEGFELEDLDFYSPIFSTNEVANNSQNIYAHTTLEHLIDTKTRIGIYTIIDKVFELKNLQTKEFHFAEELTFADIKELEIWINEMFVEDMQL